MADTADVYANDDDFPLRLDHRKPTIIFACGKKGSGKSVLNGKVFRSWPGDKLAIDVNGNAYVGPDAERVNWSDAVPGKWPELTPAPGERRRPRSLHYVANPRSATYRQDLDRAVGVALFPQEHPVLLWAGEVGELTPNSRSEPHMRQLLMQNRHFHVTALFDAPRPIGVDPLVLAQANIVAVYETPNPSDRRRIADSIGVPPKEFDAVCLDTWRRGPHWFVLYNADQGRLYSMPPLPLDDDKADDQADDQGAA